MANCIYTYNCNRECTRASIRHSQNLCSFFISKPTRNDKCKNERKKLNEKWSMREGENFYQIFVSWIVKTDQNFDSLVRNVKKHSFKDCFECR